MRAADNVRPPAACLCCFSAEDTHTRLQGLHHSVVPWLLVFLTRPLSDSGWGAGGPGFLCTNQEGICSLIDTSPLTWVSSHIHYSSSAKWAALVENAWWRGWRWRVGGVCLTSACHLVQLPAPFQHSIVCPFSLKDGRPHVAFHQTACSRCHGFIAFPHTLSASFISVRSGSSEEQTIWMAS